MRSFNLPWAFVFSSQTHIKLAASLLVSLRLSMIIKNIIALAYSEEIKPGDSIFSSKDGSEANCRHFRERKV